MAPTQVAVPAKTKSGERPMARILIVEDEPAMVAGLRDNFEFEGYDVITAPDGVAGLERALKEAPDIVILDVTVFYSGAASPGKSSHAPGAAGSQRAGALFVRRCGSGFAQLPDLTAGQGAGFFIERI